MLCADDRQLETSLDGIEAMYREYQTLWRLQYDTMLRHDKIREGVYRITYSGGTAITVDYNQNSYTVEWA